MPTRLSLNRVARPVRPRRRCVPAEPGRRLRNRRLVPSICGARPTRVRRRGALVGAHRSCTSDRDPGSSSMRASSAPSSRSCRGTTARVCLGDGSRRLLCCSCILGVPGRPEAGATRQVYLHYERLRKLIASSPSRGAHEPPASRRHVESVIASVFCGAERPTPLQSRRDVAGRGTIAEDRARREDSSATREAITRLARRRPPVARATGRLAPLL